VCGGGVVVFDWRELIVWGFLTFSSILDGSHFPKFLRHRYFGASLPFGTVEGSLATAATRSFLSSEQALADYAYLLTSVRASLNASSAATVAFGGSYGGMLASWFRLKYPHVVDGAIAGSAPIWAFEGENPPVDPEYFSDIETYDATAAGGSVDACAANYRKSWQRMFALGDSAAGRAFLQGTLRLCADEPLNTPDDVANLAAWAVNGVGFLAMGSYPYPSSYLTNGMGFLPPYPLRVGCSGLGNVSANASDAELLSAFRDAVGVWYNYTGLETCYDWNAEPNNATQLDDELWGILACAEMAMPMSQDGTSDMFYPAPWNATSYAQGCLEQWGIQTRFDWATIYFGGKRILTMQSNTSVSASVSSSVSSADPADPSTWGAAWGGQGGASNILFSNGQLDPWRGGGVTYNVSFDRDVTAWIVQDAGHHMDLMFSNPLDMPSVLFVRQQERDAIQRWVAAANAARNNL
jgi:lysosomal Pro-X carboxypeptidase